MKDEETITAAKSIFVYTSFHEIDEEIMHSLLIIFQISKHLFA